jgi:hypothetical protein
LKAGGIKNGTKGTDFVFVDKNKRMLTDYEKTQTDLKQIDVI